MYPILLCSLAGIALFVNKYLQYNKTLKDISGPIKDGVNSKPAIKIIFPQSKTSKAKQDTVRTITITQNGEIYFMDKQVDLGNRYSWCGPVDLYMQMETILCSYNYRLKNIESYGGMFFDYFR